MTSRIASVRRRQLVIAGIVAGATPTSLFAAQRVTRGPESAGLRFSVSSGERMVVSGRVVDATGSPVRGALVAARRGQLSATTDADGRFMIVANPAARHTSDIEVHVSHRSSSTNDHVFVRRADDGSWRGTLEVALT
jgi:hypothetical protein